MLVRTRARSVPPVTEPRPDGADDPAYDDLLPEQTSDDTDRGWGEHPDDVDDDERLIREKPPHW